METAPTRELYGHHDGDIVYIAEQDQNDSRVHILKKGTITNLGQSGIAFVVELSPESHLEDGSQPTTIARKPLELFSAKQIVDVLFDPALEVRPSMSEEDYVDQHMNEPTLADKVANAAAKRLHLEIVANK